MIVLDTDAVSELMRPRPAPALIEQLAQVPAYEQSTTAITLGELAYGSAKAARPDLYERALAILSGVTVLPFDQPAAARYGRVRATLEQRGEPLADPDLRIAAIALTHDVTLVTGNLRHFQRVPSLRAVSWREG